jgi:hypothetical protein
MVCPKLKAAKTETSGPSTLGPSTEFYAKFVGLASASALFGSDSIHCSPLNRCLWLWRSLVRKGLAFSRDR